MGRFDKWEKLINTFRREWYWSLNASEVRVEITAWKKNCEPYNAE